MSKRDEIVKKLQMQLDEWNAEIDKLESKIKKSQADTRIKYEAQLKELCKHRDKIKSKIEEVKEASEDALEDIGKGLEKIKKDLKESIKKALSRF